VSYRKMYDAYQRIFTRCGLKFRAVQADSGTIGGSFSHEFMVLAETGEDTVVFCQECEYAANMEKATVKLREKEHVESLKKLEKIETPGKRKVDTVCEFLNISPSQLVKTLVFMADDVPVAVLVRGDRKMEEVKLKNLLGVAEVEIVDGDKVYEITGVPTGYLGPVGLAVKIVADQEVAAMRNFYVGGNEKNYHMKNVNLGRDFQVDGVADLRQISSSDPCPECGAGLELTEGIEVGHVFKLGTGYSESMEATFQDSDGQKKHFVMGCYGIGVSRVVAAAIEQNHDANGIIFPVPLAPYTVIILNLGLKDEKITATAEQLYNELQIQGIDVILDDRDERPGSKFKDADLLGIPFRVTIGKGLSKSGLVEMRTRRNGAVEEMTPEKVIPALLSRIAAETLEKN
ncbi:MAG: proline--tRNA ligase, partial [Desulfobulbaceae bacterium]|nr:proline--tRNA ligase [Desulfobulbaceae bacterium]